MKKLTRKSLIGKNYKPVEGWQSSTGHLVRPDGTINTGKPDTGHGEAMPLHLTGKAQHTPGPWKITAEDFESFNIHTDELNICEVIAQGEYQEQGEANARLIAAAPELLEILKEVAVCGDYNDDQMKDLNERMQAILAKVTEGQKS